jgi:cytochrome P450
MLPSLIANIHDFHGYATALFAASGPGHSYEVRAPSMRFFCTCDPANVRHIFVSNFPNYPKGDDFASFFDTMGGSFFNADGESWRRQRARVQHLMASPRLLAFMAGSCCDKVERGLMPALARAASARAPFDMQELLTRFAYDMTVMPVFGVDPGLLSARMPPMDVPNAMDAVMEVGFFRHTVPISCWKLMRRLRIGPERKLAVAQPVLRRFVAEMLQKRAHENNGAQQLDIVSSYIDDPEYVGLDGEPKDFLYATIINYMFAGRDTVGTTLA